MKIAPGQTATEPSSQRRAAAPRKDPLMEVSKQFEAIFVNQMVSAMRKTVTKGGMFPQSHAEKVYQSMLDYEHAGMIAESGQIGLARMVHDHLLRTQFRR